MGLIAMTPVSRKVRNYSSKARAKHFLQLEQYGLWKSQKLKQNKTTCTGKLDLQVEVRALVQRALGRPFPLEQARKPGFSSEAAFSVMPHGVALSFLLQPATSMHCKRWCPPACCKSSILFC